MTTATLCESAAIDQSGRRKDQTPLTENTTTHYHLAGESSAQGPTWPDQHRPRGVHPLDQET